MPPLLSTSVPGAGGCSPAEALDAAKLSAAPDGERVRHLHSTVRTLRAANITSLAHLVAPPTGTGAGVGSDTPLTTLRLGRTVAHLRGLADTLLSDSRLCRSAQLDVAQLVACVMCDLIRLNAEANATGLLPPASTEPQTGGTAKSTRSAAPPSPPHQQPLPFALSLARTALELIARPFRLLCEAGEGGPSSPVSLHRCELVIERTAATRALRVLLPYAMAATATTAAPVLHLAQAPPPPSSLLLSSRPTPRGEGESDVESTLQPFFSSVRFDTGSGLPHTAAGSVVPGRSASLTAEMSRTLGDILEAANAVTEAQLQPLLAQVLAASPALRVAGVGVASTGGDGGVPVSIAAKVFLDQVDVIQPAIASVAADCLEQGVGSLTALEFQASTGGLSGGGGGAAGSGTAKTSTDPQRAEMQRQRRPALREIARALEIFTAMMELNVNLCGQLVPLLLPYLSHELADVRLLLYRGFAAAWTSSPEAFPAYRSAFLTARNRFQDVRPSIRVEAVASARTIVHHAVRARWPAALIAETWRALQPPLTQRLTDLHVAVRLQAVQSYADILEVLPAAGATRDSTRVEEGAGREARDGSGCLLEETDGAGESLAASTLGRRTADRNARVRERAVQCLCRLYRAQPQLAWIPDAVVNAVHAEGGVRLVEQELESMLPPPTSADATVTREGVRGGGGGRPSGSRTATLAVFDFEKEAEAGQPVRDYVTAWTKLCEDLHPPQFALLLAVVRAKPQLRRTIARLFELRAELKAMPDPRSPQAAATIHAVERLLAFLQSTTHAEKGEWDALFRSRDDHVARAMQAVCAPRAPTVFSATSAGGGGGGGGGVAGAAGSIGWGAEREALRAALKGRVESEVYRFVSESLVRQVMLPLDAAHVDVLLEALDDAFRLSRLTASWESGEGGGAVPLARPAPALLRTVLVFASAAPSVLPRCAGALLRALQAITHAAASVDVAKTAPHPPVHSTDTLLLILQSLEAWAAYAAASLSSMGRGSTAAPPAAPSMRDTVDTLRDLALGSRAALLLSLSDAADGPAAGRHPASVPWLSSVRTGALSRVGRSAARAYLALCSTSGLLSGPPDAAPALVEALCASLEAYASRLGGVPQDKDGATTAAVAGVAVGAATSGRGSATLTPRSAGRRPSDGAGEDADTVRIVASLAAIRSVAEDRVSAAALAPHREDLTRAVVSIFFDAVAHVGDRAEVARLSRRGSLVERCGQLQGYVSIASATADAAAEALTSLALCAAPENRGAAVGLALDALLQGYRMAVFRPGGVSTIGSSQRRLAIGCQLARLLVQPSAAIGKELAVAVVFSAEEEEVVLLGIQRALTAHLVADSIPAAVGIAGASAIPGAAAAAALAGPSAMTLVGGGGGVGSDVRYAAFLLLTAMACGGRGSYQELKACVAAVATRMRARQAALSATLGDPAALQCYLEYTIPFLILFMSHHSFYTEESTTYRFINYQRVWQLLFDELLRHGTQCASFVVGLLARIKVSDDVVDPASDRHRVLCDLCSRVMLECLGQRQISLDTLKRYPGAVLLPSFYVKSRRADVQRLSETVFLDPSVVVSATAAFRVPAGAEGGGAGSRMNSRSHSRSSSSSSCTSRASSRPRARAGRLVDTPTADAHQLQLTATGDNDVDDEVADVDPTHEGEDAVVMPGLRASGGRRRSRQERSTSPSAPALRRARESPAAGVGSRSSGLAESGEASSPRAGTRAPMMSAVEKGVDGVLSVVLKGLRRSEIARLRWRAVRERIESEVLDQHAGSTTAMREAAFDYARERLRARYEEAEP